MLLLGLFQTIAMLHFGALPLRRDFVEQSIGNETNLRHPRQL